VEKEFHLKVIQVKEEREKKKPQGISNDKDQREEKINT
jgi:hypothetical protein